MIRFARRSATGPLAPRPLALCAPACRPLASQSPAPRSLAAAPALVVVLIAALAASGCGRKGPLEPVSPDARSAPAERPA